MIRLSYTSLILSGRGGSGVEECGAAGGEGASVVWREAVRLDGGEMGCRAIAGVSLPVVLGVLLGKMSHQMVAVDLCHNGGGSYGGDPAVTPYDRLVGDLEVATEAVAIDEEVLRAGLQPLDGSLHGEEGGSEDIQPVYLLDGGAADGDGDRFLPYGEVVVLATMGCELLGVGQSGEVKVLREDHSSGHYRSGKAAATYLVDARFKADGLQSGGEVEGTLCHLSGSGSPESGSQSSGRRCMKSLVWR